MALITHPYFPSSSAADGPVSARMLFVGWLVGVRVGGGVKGRGSPCSLNKKMPEMLS